MNKQKTKGWYRCVMYASHGCKATAVLDVAKNHLVKVTSPHIHGPSFLSSVAR